MKKTKIFLVVAGRIGLVYIFSLISMLLAGRYDPEHVVLSLIRDSLLPVFPFAAILAINEWRKESLKGRKEPPKH